MQSLPEDILVVVLSFLDVRSLLSVETVQTCHITARMTVWKNLLQSDFLHQARRDSNCKKKYIAMYKERQHYIKVSINNSKKLVLLQHKAVEHFNLRENLICLTSTLATCGPLVLLLLFTSMLANKLNNGSLKEVPYVVIFIPIWLFILLYAVVFAVTCFAARTVNRKPEDSGWRDQWMYVKATIVGFIIDKILLQNARAYRYCAVLSCGLVLIPIVLCVKLDAATSLPWTVAMLPIFLVLGCWLFVPLANFVFKHHMAEFLVLNLFLWLPTVVVLALTAAKLDGANIAAHWVFMPYWVLDGLMFCMGTVAMCGGFIKESRHPQNQNLPFCRTFGPFCATYTVGCCLLAPLVLFCAFVSIKEYYDISQVTIFAPLIGWFVLTSLVSLCFARIFTHNNKSQTRREVLFSSSPRLVV
jgi:hypothetical protein